MVALHEDLDQAAHGFKWPTEGFDESSVPIARLIDVPDNEVTPKYWRRDKIREDDVWQHQGIAHKIQVIARIRPGMGLSNLPHSIQSWEGLLNGPTTLGGGGRRT